MHLTVRILPCTMVKFSSNYIVHYSAKQLYKERNLKNILQ